MEATIPTQHTVHCRLFSSHSIALRQNRGTGCNTDSTHLSLPSIFVTFYGFSSKRRWRLQYRLNIPFTAVYFHHIIWLFVNAKVEATIPTKHTFHCGLFPSHSMVLRQNRGGGYNTDSTYLSLPFIFVTFYGFSSTQRWRLQYRLNTPFTAVYFHHILWFFVKTEVKATIPTQHTFHCRLFSSHSMALRQNRGVGYNTDSTHLSLPFIFVTFYGFSSTSANCDCLHT